jgi:hypothetical protein
MVPRSVWADRMDQRISEKMATVIAQNTIRSTSSPGSWYFMTPSFWSGDITDPYAGGRERFLLEAPGKHVHRYPLTCTNDDYFEAVHVKVQPFQSLGHAAL